MSTRRYHLSVNIEGLLEQYRKKSMRGLLTTDGKKLSDAQAREFCYQCLREGMRVLPIGDCEDFDPIEGCPGHDVKKDK